MIHAKTWPVESALGVDEPLSDKAYRLIETMIITLELAPGARLTEAFLVERTGLGRTPVREAVLRLVSEGFIVVIPRKGMMVSEVSAGEILKAFDVRHALEMIAARRAAERGTGAAGERLLAIYAEMLSAARAGDAPRYLDADKLFDFGLSAAADSIYLELAMNPLRSAIRRGWYYFNGVQSLETSAEAHGRLAKAIHRGDVPGAIEAASALVNMARVQIT